MTAGSWRPPPPPRSPWQHLYAAAHRLRAAWHRGRRRTLPAPVVSIGNLHWGGTGKTPLVAAAAGHLRDRGLTVAVLSRGYRRRSRGVKVVSVGDGPLLGPLLAGDEPVLLAGQLPGVAVVVGADRFEAGRHALERLAPPPELFLLDDGFSHLALARQLDIVALPAADPFGGGRLPPSGRLREPLASLARADAVVVTDCEGSAAGLAEALAPYGFAGAAFASRTLLLPPRLLSGQPLPPDERVLAVAAIARPERFFAAVAAARVETVDRIRLPDHHDYDRRTVERIERAAREHGAGTVLTTAKDAVKLLGRIELPLAELPIRAEPEAAFWRWLDRRLAALAEAAR